MIIYYTESDLYSNPPMYYLWNEEAGEIAKINGKFYFESITELGEAYCSSVSNWARAGEAWNKQMEPKLCLFWKNGTSAKDVFPEFFV